MSGEVGWVNDVVVLLFLLLQWWYQSGDIFKQ